MVYLNLIITICDKGNLFLAHRSQTSGWTLLISKDSRNLSKMIQVLAATQIAHRSPNDFYCPSRGSLVGKAQDIMIQIMIQNQDS